MSVDKERIVNALIDLQQQRKVEFELYMQDLQGSLQSEGKSTAGDKHETGRAMVHLEMEKAQHQLENIQLMMEQLQRIQRSAAHLTSSFGSFILTDSDRFLIGVGLGKQLIHGQLIYCVGLDAPIANLLMHKNVGDVFLFNGTKQTIRVIA